MSQQRLVDPLNTIQPLVHVGFITVCWRNPHRVEVVDSGSPPAIIVEIDEVTVYLSSPTYSVGLHRTVHWWSCLKLLTDVSRAFGVVESIVGIDYMGKLMASIGRNCTKRYTPARVVSGDVACFGSQGSRSCSNYVLNI